MERSGPSWSALEAHGALWTLTERSGRSWSALEAHGAFWALMERPWSALEAHGALWKHVEGSGRSWRDLKVLGALTEQKNMYLVDPLILNVLLARVLSTLHFRGSTI